MCERAGRSRRQALHAHQVIHPALSFLVELFPLGGLLPLRFDGLDPLLSVHDELDELLLGQRLQLQDRRKVLLQGLQALLSLFFLPAEGLGRQGHFVGSAAL